MSERGREVVAWLADGETQGEWWTRYAERLTPDERKAIRRGDYRAFRRPLAPAFGAGLWLEASKNLAVRIATVEPQRGQYRCVIDRVRDLRSARALDRRLHERLDPEAATTLDVGSEHRVDPPEPERIPHEIIKRLPATNRAAVLYEQTQVARRQADDALPLAVRVQRISSAGPQARRQLRAIEALVVQAERRVGLRRAV